MTKQFTMEDRFNPSAVEQALYQHWESQGYLSRVKILMHRATVSLFRRRM